MQPKRWHLKHTALQEEQFNLKTSLANFTKHIHFFTFTASWVWMVVRIFNEELSRDKELRWMWRFVEVTLVLNSLT